MRICVLRIVWVTASESREGRPMRVDTFSRVVRVVGAFIKDQAGAISSENTWVLVFLSRSLNVLTGGSHQELLCSRAYRKGWAICWYIDRIFQVMRADDPEHCRACFLGNKRSGRIRRGACR